MLLCPNPPAPLDSQVRPTHLPLCKPAPLPPPRAAHSLVPLQTSLAGLIKVLATLESPLGLVMEYVEGSPLAAKPNFEVGGGVGRGGGAASWQLRWLEWVLRLCLPGASCSLLLLARSSIITPACLALWGGHGCTYASASIPCSSIFSAPSLC